MRLINQNGTKDYPYETSYLRIKYEEYCREGEYPKFHKVFSIYANDSSMGEYSTKEKALKVMEMLRNQYKRFMTTALMDIKKENIYFKFPADEDVKE